MITEIPPFAWVTEPDIQIIVVDYEEVKYRGRRITDIQRYFPSGDTIIIPQVILELEKQIINAVMHRIELWGFATIHCSPWVLINKEEGVCKNFSISIKFSNENTMSFSGEDIYQCPRLNKIEN